jgi:hypothetical protein
MKKITINSKVHNLTRRLLLMLSTGAVIGSIMLGGSVSALSPKAAAADNSTTSSTGSSSSSTGSSSANTQKNLQTIISKGDAEIARRMTTLGTLTSKINAASKLTANDKTTLSNEVSSSTSGLTSLKSQLDSATSLSAARVDVEDIFTEYRVYALIAPKVDIIKVADDQQVIESDLNTLSQKLQTRITQDQQAGKNVATMQSELSDLNSKVSAAQSISSNIENTVINLQPTDYNSNHDVLSGDNTQLKTAHNDNLAADQDAKNIVAGLKSE